MICRNCQATLPEDALFCGECGTNIQVDVAAGGASPAPLGTIDSLQTTFQPARRPDEASTALAKGDVFDGRFEITDRVGAGGMGVVYRATDRNTNEDVALKLLHPNLVSGPEAMSRLVAEGVTARKIRHPNIVAVYDVAQSGMQPYMSMEFVQGETLRSWITNLIRGGGEAPVAVAVKIVREILAGMAEAHRMGVIHRDLKPENVLISGDPARDNFQLKILDFGIARATRRGDTPTGGGSVGTPPYQAPEQITASDTVGPAADIYALSVILYELLMETPFQGAFDAPSKSRADVPVALDQVLERGLKRRARDRYQTAEEFGAALDQALQGRQPPAGPPAGPPPPPPPSPPPSPLTPQQPDLPTISPAAKKFLGNKRLWLIGGIAAILVIGIGAYLDERQQEQAQVQRARQEQVRQDQARQDMSRQDQARQEQARQEQARRDREQRDRDRRVQAQPGLDFQGATRFFVVDEKTNYRYDGVQSGDGTSISFSAATPIGFLQATGRMKPGDCWFNLSNPSIGINNIRATCMIVDSVHIPFGYTLPNGAVYSSCLHLNHGATTTCSR